MERRLWQRILADLTITTRRFLNKTNLTNALPSYQHSQKGLFQEADQKNKVKMNYKQRVGVGADLSDVINGTFKPERDYSKINNSLISEKDRTDVYISPSKGDKIAKRNMNISPTNNFLKSYEESLNANTRRNEDVKASNLSTLVSSEKLPGGYEFGSEYYLTGVKRYKQEEWAERVSRKKQIGPHHNSISNNFILPTYKGGVGRNAGRDMMRNSMNDVRTLSTKHILYCNLS